MMHADKFIEEGRQNIKGVETYSGGKKYLGGGVEIPRGGKHIEGEQTKRDTLTVLGGHSSRRVSCLGSDNIKLVPHQ
jgi:hypothetical protein